MERNEDINWFVDEAIAKCNDKLEKSEPGSKDFSELVKEMADLKAIREGMSTESKIKEKKKKENIDLGLKIGAIVLPIVANGIGLILTLGAEQSGLVRISNNGWSKFFGKNR